jgi:hypothetical protein
VPPSPFDTAARELTTTSKAVIDGRGGPEAGSMRHLHRLLGAGLDVAGESIPSNRSSDRPGIVDLQQVDYVNTAS